MPKRPQTQFSLEQAVGASPNLAALRARVQQSERCLDVVLPLIPVHLRQQVRSGPLESGQWCLLAQSTAASTKLRQLLPSLHQLLQEKGMDVQEIRIKVQRTNP